MRETKKALFVILASENGRDGWRPVKHDDLPQWLLDPDVLGRLVNGDVAMKCDEWPKGSLHYRAIVYPGAQQAARINTALKAREKREAEVVMLTPPSNDAFLTIETSELRH